MITATKITKWKTSDGVEHSTEAMAHQHILNRGMVDLLVQYCDLSEHDAQEVLNVFSGRPEQVRAWLDASDAMDKSVR